MIPEIKEIYEKIEKNYDNTMEKVAPRYLSQYEHALSTVENKDELMPVMEYFFTNSYFKEMRLASIKGFLEEVSVFTEKGFNCIVNRNYPMLVLTNQKSGGGSLADEFVEVDPKGKIGSHMLKLNIEKFLLHFPFNFTVKEQKDVMREIVGRTPNLQSVEKQKIEVALAVLEKNGLMDTPKDWNDMSIMNLENTLDWQIFRKAYSIISQIDKVRDYPDLNLSKMKYDLLEKQFERANDKMLFIERVFGGESSFYEKHYAYGVVENCPYSKSMNNDLLIKVIEYLENSKEILSDKAFVNLVKLNNDTLSGHIAAFTSEIEDDFFNGGKEKSVVISEKFVKVCREQVLRIYKKNGNDSFLNELFSENLDREILISSELLNAGLLCSIPIEQDKMKNGIKKISDTYQVEFDNEANKVTFVLNKSFVANINCEKDHYFYELLGNIKEEYFKIESGPNLSFKVQLDFDAPIKIEEEFLVDGLINVFKESILKLKDTYGHNNLNSLMNFVNPIDKQIFNSFMDEMRLLNKLDKKIKVPQKSKNKI